MAHDLVIRGGLIVDGTGAPGRAGNLAVTGGRIAEVGAVSGRGAREVDARGLVVAPGFIDPHTHYDAQITWDPSASCTSWHGVTTIVTGNCGFTLAPCRPEDRLTLRKMLEYVEGMSLEAMQKRRRADPAYRSGIGMVRAGRGEPVGLEGRAKGLDEVRPRIEDCPAAMSGRSSPLSS